MRAGGARWPPPATRRDAGLRRLGEHGLLALGRLGSEDHLALHVRERADVGQRGRLDDVGADALAGRVLAGELEHDAGLAERVLAGGDGVDAEIAELDLTRGGRV